MVTADGVKERGLYSLAKQALLLDGIVAIEIIELSCRVGFDHISGIVGA